MLPWFKKRKNDSPQNSGNAPEPFVVKVNEILENCPTDANLFPASKFLVIGATFIDEAVIEKDIEKLNTQIGEFETQINAFKKQSEHENVGTTNRDLELVLEAMSRHVKNAPIRPRQ